MHSVQSVCCSQCRRSCPRDSTRWASRTCRTRRPAAGTPRRRPPEPGFRSSPSVAACRPEPLADGLLGVLGALHRLFGGGAGALLVPTVGVCGGHHDDLVAGAIVDGALGDARLLDARRPPALVGPGAVVLTRHFLDVLIS